MECSAFSPNTWTMCSDSANSNRSDFYPLEGTKIVLAEQASVKQCCICGAFVAQPTSRNVCDGVNVKSSSCLSPPKVRMNMLLLVKVCKHTVSFCPNEVHKQTCQKKSEYISYYHNRTQMTRIIIPLKNCICVHKRLCLMSTDRWIMVTQMVLNRCKDFIALASASILISYLVLVGGVERDFSHFGVSGSHVTNAPAAQLNAFQQSWLWRVPSRLPLGKHIQTHRHALAQSVKCACWGMSLVCLAACVCPEPVEESWLKQHLRELSLLPLLSSSMMQVAEHDLHLQRSLFGIMVCQVMKQLKGMIIFFVCLFLQWRGWRGFFRVFSMKTSHCVGNGQHIVKGTH